MIFLIPIFILFMNMLFAWYLSTGMYAFFILSEFVYMGFFLNTDFMRMKYRANKVFYLNGSILITISVVSYFLPYELTSFMFQSALVALSMDVLNLLIFNKVTGLHLKKSFLSTLGAGMIDSLIMNGYFVYRGDISFDTYIYELTPVRLAVVLVIYAILYYLRNKGIYKEVGKDTYY